MKIGVGSIFAVTGAEAWLDHIRNGRAFAGELDLSASVGNFSHGQLFNPAASGKILVVRYVFAKPGAAGLYVLRDSTVALTTNDGTQNPLKIGGAAGVGQIRSQNSAGLLGGQTLEAYRPTADPMYPLVDDWFVELTAGEGLIAVPVTVNTANTLTFRWIEL